MDIDLFKKCMGSFVTGVTVITVIGNNNKPFGITINSFTSLSLEPQLILFCLDKNSFTNKFFDIGKNFVVNILSENQQDISIFYAFEDHYNFSNVDYKISSNNIPILANTIATVECVVCNKYENGDHSIIVGKINSLYVDENQKPLLYYRGKYLNL